MMTKSNIVGNVNLMNSEGNNVSVVPATDMLYATKSEISMWDDEAKIQEIKKLYAPTLTDSEFLMFMGIAKASNCNPYLREIYAVKYNGKAASIFIARDGYRKGAQQHPQYDYHQVDAVYEGDDFSIKDGQVSHSYKLANRGKLIGAYCIAKRKSSSRPMYVFVNLGEYNTNQSVWSSKPATMIKKVAEAQCLRACFQDLFSNTYAEEEKFVDAEYSNQANLKNIDTSQSRTNILKQIINQEEHQNAQYDSEGESEILQAEMDESISSSPGSRGQNAESGRKNHEFATQNQILDLLALMEEKQVAQDRKQDAFKYFKIKALEELTQEQANLFIKWIADDKLNKKNDGEIN